MTQPINSPEVAGILDTFRQSSLSGLFEEVHERFFQQKVTLSIFVEWMNATHADSPVCDFVLEEVEIEEVEIAEDEASQAEANATIDEVFGTDEPDEAPLELEEDLIAEEGDEEDYSEVPVPFQTEEEEQEYSNTPRYPSASRRSPWSK